MTIMCQLAAHIPSLLLLSMKRSSNRQASIANIARSKPASEEFGERHLQFAHTAGHQTIGHRRSGPKGDRKMTDHRARI